MVIWLLSFLLFPPCVLLLFISCTTPRMNEAEKTGRRSMQPPPTSVPPSSSVPTATATATPGAEKGGKEAKTKEKSPKKAESKSSKSKSASGNRGSKNEKRKSKKKEKGSPKQKEKEIKTDRTLVFDAPIESEKEQVTEIPSIEEDNPLACKHVQQKLRTWAPTTEKTVAERTVVITESKIITPDFVDKTQNDYSTTIRMRRGMDLANTQEEFYVPNADMNQPEAERKVEMSMRPKKTDPRTKSAYY